MKKCISTIFLLLLFSFSCIAQNNIENFLTPSDALNSKRIEAVTISSAAVATASLVGLGYVWYSDYEKSSFHFINDNSHWLQMDKAGHLYSGYHLSRAGAELLRWSGMESEKSAVIGAVSGFVVLSAVEVLDGFSAEWGASTGDLIANASGSGLYIAQELLWKEQRIIPKYSFHTTKYAQIRPNLLGNNLQEQILKDYNGQTYWLSVNLYSFIKSESIPKFVNIAFGYGVDGMISGLQPEVIVGQNNYDRSRQFYFSFDLDLTKIPTKSHVLKTIFSVFNTIKIPAPTFELSDNGRVKGYILYF
ncbi:MAG: DUF2279 domain-containing protein [Flavobacterium sp.]